MKKIKFIFLAIIFTFSFSFQSNSKAVPESFADLAEKLMPSVVNISTTQTIVTNTNPFPFQFPPGSPFEDMFKEFGTPQERKSAALGSGFIIDEKGIVVTNNHVIQDAEDIIVRVNGDQEFKAKVLVKFSTEALQAIYNKLLAFKVEVELDPMLIMFPKVFTCFINSILQKKVFLIIELIILSISSSEIFNSSVGE